MCLLPEVDGRWSLSISPSHSFRVAGLSHVCLPRSGLIAWSKWWPRFGAIAWRSSSVRSWPLEEEMGPGCRVVDLHCSLSRQQYLRSHTWNKNVYLFLFHYLFDLVFYLHVSLSLFIPSLCISGHEFSIDLFVAYYYSILTCIVWFERLRRISKNDSSLQIRAHFASHFTFTLNKVSSLAHYLFFSSSYHKNT